MLVLTRKKNERIVIGGVNGEQIVITVVELSNGKTRIGIDAPKDIPIVRGELEQRERAA